MYVRNESEFAGSSEEKEVVVEKEEERISCLEFVAKAASRASSRKQSLPESGL